MGQRILALELGGESVRAALADRTLKQLDLIDLFEQHRGDGEHDLVGALSRIVATSGPPDLTISCLPGETVAKRLLALPFADRRRLNQVVPFALEEHLPFAIDDAIVAHARIGRRESNSIVLAACARREEVRRHLDLMARAGLDPKTVTLGAQALAGLLAHARNGQKRPHLMLEVADESTSIILVDEAGGIRALRTIAQRLDLDAPAARTLLATIRQTLLAHAHELHDADIVVAGPRAADQAFREELSADLDLPVLEFGDFDCSTLIHGAKETTRFAGCLGMLLSEAPVEPLELLNFRQNEFSFRGRIKGIASWRLPAALAATLAGVAVLHLLLAIMVNARELHVLDSAIAASVAPALGDTDPATARATLQNKLKEMNGRLRLLGGNLAGGSPLDI